jgi:hypothetical protein
MKKIIFTVYLSLLSLAIFAQTGGSIMDKIDPNFLNKDLLYETGTYSSFDGNPYLFEDVREACLVLSDGKDLCEVKVNYDAFENSILLKEKDNDDVNYVNPQFVRSFTVDGFKYVKADINKVGNENYYQVLYSNDDYALYRFKEVELKYRDTQGNTGYSSANKKSKYFSISENFVFVSGEEILIEGRLKKLLKSLDDFNYRDIKKYTKSEDLDLDKDVDIVNLMKHLDEN